MELNTILSIASIVIYLVLIVLTVIIKRCTNSKTKQTAQTTYDIVKTIQQLIIKAETHIGYTGVDKFDFVMTNLDKYLIENKLTLDTETKTNLIENEIVLSNNVNTNKTNKENEQKQVG